MAHNKIIDSVKKHGQVAIKDLDELLRFVINESDMRTYHRDRGDDLEIDSVVVDTPVVLKNAETLFLNILKEENITYGYLYNVADKLWYATDTVQDNRFFVLDENFIDAHT